MIRFEKYMDLRFNIGIVLFIWLRGKDVLLVFIMRYVVVYTLLWIRLLDVLVIILCNVFSILG